MNLIEGLYYIGYSIKKYNDLKNQKKLPFKVISIGNITVGGTGKTPATITIAEEAKRRGFVPVILTRGYKGKTKGPCFVSKGEGPLLSEEDAGDEPIIMAGKLKGVPIVKGENRYDAGIFAIENLKSEISNLKSQILFILDDGFQHWKLFRDKDLLLIDGTNPFGNKRLLPVGPLREPLRAISRADIVVITKTNMLSSQSTVHGQSTASPTYPSPLRGEGKGGGDISQSMTHGKSEFRRLIKEIRKYNKKAPVFSAEHRPLQFLSARGEIFPLEWAKGKRFFVFSGIGNPGSFKETLLLAGINLKGFKSYRDHYRYAPKDIEKIVEHSKRSGADWIVTTEKDIMRLKELSVPANLIALVIEFSVGKEFYDEVFTTQS
ncbi:MAG: tetraacyldisaccharide 4'-kinase [Nitrospirota bacterium]